MMIVQMASSNTILQTLVDEDKRGRVMCFYAMAFVRLGIIPGKNEGLGVPSNRPPRRTTKGRECSRAASPGR